MNGLFVMPPPTVLIDHEALGRAKKLYRQRVQKEPRDIAARIELAWCLFIESLHQAGWESALAAPISDEAKGLSAETVGQPTAREEARTLLAECLRETCRVRQLSAVAAEQQEADRLQALAKLAMGEEALSNASASASEAVKRLMQAIIRNEDVPPRLPR
jgi:hypothetical protein